MVNVVAASVSQVSPGGIWGLTRAGGQQH